MNYFMVDLIRLECTDLGIAKGDEDGVPSFQWNYKAGCFARGRLDSVFRIVDEDAQILRACILLDY